LKKTCYTVFFPKPLDYAPVLALQLHVCDLKKRGFAPDLLLLLEHLPVITLGRNGDWHHLVVSDEILQSKGVSRYHVDRGGDITFHGPGQLVGYPLLQLERHEQDVHRYMRNLEEAIIRTLKDHEIEAQREAKLTGVWTSGGKICALGVHISRWITRHGFALNVNTDLSYYNLIVPCGLAGRSVTSMHAVLKREVGIQEVAAGLTEHFGRLFEREMEPISVAGMLDLLGGPSDANLRGLSALVKY